MAYDDDEELFESDDDDDDGFNDDFEALRRACLLTGTNPSNFQKQSPSAAVTAAIGSGGGDTRFYSDEDNDAEDDLELVRNIQKRFSIVTDDMEPLTVEPLCSIRTVEETAKDDLEDDFEILRTIQRRFAAYSGNGLKNSMENVSPKPENGGVTNLSLEEETFDNLFVDSSSAQEEIHRYVGKITNITNSELCTNVNTGTKPCDLTEWHESSSGDAGRLLIKGSSFPKAAEAFIDAIKKNRSCQKLIRSKLVHVEARMQELKELKERVKILKDFQVSCRKRTGRALSQKKDARAQLISASKLSLNSKLNEKKPSSMQYGPAENSQVAKYREALEKFPAVICRKKWPKEENEKLANGVKQQFQEMLLQRSLDILSDGGGLIESSGDFDSIVASIGNLGIAPEQMRLFLPKVNWDHLASMYVPGRSGAECQARWLNCEDSLINQNPWTSVEDKNLLHIIQQTGLSNWIDIAVSLGTNRTPFQCLARYQRSLNASILKREWTEEEDNELRAAVEAFGESNWQSVASAMEGRTGTQCSNRWLKTLHPTRQRVGRWTPDEDKRLKVAVMLFGPKNWKKIAEFVPGRTQVQCRERWVNSLNPSLNLDTWTQEEDSKLKEAIEYHGYCWSKVAACIPPRTDSQCRRRWKVLLPHQVPLLQAARKMQKAALISNFVDRESERPALQPNDFVPLREIACIAESRHVNPSVKQQNRVSRRRKEDAHANPSSGDPCSEEVPSLVNGTEAETLTNNLTSRNKRRKRHLEKTKSICSPEEDLSCVPDSLESLAIINMEELEAPGVVCGRPKRDYLNPKTAISRARKRRPKKDGGSDKAESNVSSLGDLNSSMITGGEEVSELIRDNESAACPKQASGLYPNNSSCSYGQEEDGGRNDTEQHQCSLTYTNLLMIDNLEEAREVCGNDGATTWQGEVSELYPSSSGIPISYHTESSNKDNIIVVNNQRHKTKSTSKKHQSAEDSAHHLSSLSTLKTNCSGASGASDINRLEGSRNRGWIASEAAVDDDLTLAAFCKKKLPAADTRDDDDDDDMSLASFCSKLKKKKKNKVNFSN